MSARLKLEFFSVGLSKDINKTEAFTYFLGSERSADNFLVFANCSNAGGARLLPGNDWIHSGSAYEWAVADETLGLDASWCALSSTPTKSEM